MQRRRTYEFTFYKKCYRKARLEEILWFNSPTEYRGRLIETRGTQLGLRRDRAVLRMTLNLHTTLPSRYTRRAALIRSQYAHCLLLYFWPWATKKLADTKTKKWWRLWNWLLLEADYIEQQHNGMKNYTLANTDFT